MIIIQTILYKSQNKLPRFIKSINLMNFPKDQFKVYFLNNFADDTGEYIKGLNPEFDYEYADNPNGNVGFGRGHNYVFNECSGQNKYFLMTNPDTIFFPDMLDKLIDMAEKNPNAMLVEPAQFPVEHAQVFDENFEKYWCTGVCLLVRSEYFRKIGGFDENIFMYCEDIDLSFRAWLNGYTCLYNPHARIVHITQHFDPNKDLSTEYYFSRLYTLYILRKYFSEEDVERYKRERISQLSQNIVDKILNDFDAIKNYDVELRKKLPHPKIKLFNDFSFSPTRWQI